MANKLFVGSLAWATNNDSLRDHFANVVTVESASVVTDRESGRSRGFGFVEVASPEDVQTAIDKLNGSELDGRTINVSEAKPKAE
ncbi:MAG: RNA-binding protein [Candidatus Doudnabacteria bacterium]